MRIPGRDTHWFAVLRGQGNIPQRNAVLAALAAQLSTAPLAGRKPPRRDGKDGDSQRKDARDRDSEDNVDDDGYDGDFKAKKIASVDAVIGLLYLHSQGESVVEDSLWLKTLKVSAIREAQLAYTHD